jgi:hypothetical protein
MGKATTMTVTVSSTMCQLMDQDAKDFKGIVYHWGDQDLMGSIIRCTGRPVLTDGTI